LKLNDIILKSPDLQKSNSSDDQRIVDQFQPQTFCCISEAFERQAKYIGNATNANHEGQIDIENDDLIGFKVSDITQIYCSTIHM